MTEHVIDYDTTAFKPRHRWERLAANCLGFRKKRAAMERHCRGCAEEINAGSFDVLLATNCWDFAVPPIAKHIRIPKLLYHNEPKRHLYEARPKLPWVARPADENRLWPYSKLRRLISDYDSVVCKRVELREELDSVSAFDLILANSAFSRESMLRSYGLESRVCYLGVNTQLFKSTRTDRERHVVGLGAFQPHKGIETAIAALATIPPVERPRLVWIGNLLEASYRNEIITLAEKLAVEFETRQLISDSALVDCLNQAALMIYTPRLEPFGLAPLEANACGTPVVAIAEGGIRETIKHGVNGLLVPDRDPQALGAAVLKLLQEPMLARNLGETGRKLVCETWTLEAAVKRLEGFLLQVTQKQN